jgi:SAM-dependent methyltransferase
MMRGYREDLAYIHDVGYGHFARRAAPGLLEMLRQTGAVSGLVVDLGCGSGIWARELCDAGYDVLGVDQSAAMIAMACNRVPEGTFRQGSFLTAKFPPCVAVTAVGECFNYLFDRRNSRRKLLGLFCRVYNALHSGGIFIFDVAGPGRGAKLGSQRHHREGKDWAVFVATEEDRQRMLLTRSITSFRKIGNLYRRDEEVHRLRLYRPTELANSLRDCGFRVRTLRGYGPMCFPPGLHGFRARRP